MKDMDYIYRKKGNEESGNMTLYHTDGSVVFAGDMNSLKGRGNSTWTQFEKKPFALKLENAADLLGMGEAEKWILFANADDPSNMRNKMVYDYADAVGLPYSPDSQWVDLVIELRTKEGSELVKRIMDVKGVTSASLLSHDGEVTF